MIKLGEKFIGQGAPCFIAAEIGINHNGDMDLAKKTIDAAVEAGVDAVKFQNYYTEDFVLNREITYTYQSEGRTVTETQFNMFSRYELSFSQLKELKEYCDKKKILFFSTPTGKKGIDDLVKLDCKLLKNGSDFLVNTEIIADMARTGIPLIISTGMATLAEIDDAVRVFEEQGGKELIILLCTSSYPTPPGQVNLAKIPALQSAFNYPVGFSDHTYGVVAAIGSIVLGSCFLEKHFTLNKSLPGPDHHFSSDKEEMKELVEAIRTIEKNMGQSRIGPADSELKGRKEFRLSCVASKKLGKGHVLCNQDITFSRPSGGLEPKHKNLLIGKPLKHEIIAGNMITFDDLLPANL